MTSLREDSISEKEFISVAIRARWKTIYRGKDQADERVFT